ncbi:MAG TPA: S4 domain-containing protein, partial [Steroidobacteraceae bacterium]|nr:S4 domain-containing protein [Steroidobacteraceae bacterium]
MRERIQKVLSARGVGSRRQVEAWIAAGRITVNGKPAVPGQPIGERDDVRLDNRRLRLGRGAVQAHAGVAYHRPAQEGVRT